MAAKASEMPTSEVSATGALAATGIARACPVDNVFGRATASSTVLSIGYCMKPATEESRFPIHRVQL